MLLWIECPEGTIVGGEPKLVGDPDSNLGTTLLHSMESPAIGVPRRPTSIRVASAHHAAEVRAVIGDSIPIRVAPTPEVDEARSYLEEHLGEPDEAGLLDDDVPDSAIAELFRSVALMAKARPWAVMRDFLLRLDVPDLDVDGVCVNLVEDSDVGGGMLVFPSLEAQLTLEATWDEDMPDPGEGVDLGSGWLALTFVSRDEIPVTMREEIKQKGWEVAGRRWYPVVQSFNRLGTPVTVMEKDLRVIAAAALASAAMVADHQPTFDGPELLSISDDEGRAIYLSGPWEEFDLPGPNDPEFLRYHVPGTAARTPTQRPTNPGSKGNVSLSPIASGFGSPIPRTPNSPSAFKPRASRNAPCPCGSGKKYKKCCLDSDLAGAETTHARDRRLIDDMQTFAFETFGATWLDMTEDFTDLDRAVALAMDWSVYVAEFRGKPIVDWYLESAEISSREDRRWLEAQRRAWLSVWEVRKVEPRRSLVLRDALTGLVYEVSETHASVQLERGDLVLARLVEFDGEVTISGLHPCPLPLLPAFDVIESMHHYLRLKRAVRPARLLPYRVARRLLFLWEDALLHGNPLMWDKESTAVDRQSATRAHKKAHYAGWPDLPIPALDNQTPREAVVSEAGRKRVAALLDEMERSEQRMDPETAFDFGELREKLGLGQRD